MDINQAVEPITAKVETWGDTLTALLPNIAVALLVIATAWLLARVVRRITERLAAQASVRSAVTRLLGTVTFTVVVGIGLFFALGVLKLDKTVTSLLAGAGVVGLALGFAAQNLAANLISGTVISLRRPYKEGDLVDTAGHFGTVDRIDLRITRIRTPDGQLVLIPNKDILESPLVNYSTHAPRRVDLEVGVSYDADLDQVKEITLDAVQRLDGLQPDTDIDFMYSEFGASSINFEVRFWIPGDRQSDFLEARSEAIMRIKQAFDAHDITIPFPIRTLDFGIEGGVGLADALRPVARDETRQVA